MSQKHRLRSQECPRTLRYMTLLTLAALSGNVTCAEQIPAPRNTRHALIIGIGEYSAPGVPPLAGVVHDVVSATRIARAMAVPEANIRVIRDHEATAERIRAEISALDSRIRDGDRVFFYYSGHGTRWQERADSPVCVEGLYATDGKVLNNSEIGQRLTAISKRADKMLVFYDACFSGGVASAPFRTRAARFGKELLTPKFTPQGANQVCANPTNFRTRNLAVVMEQRQAPAGNVVHIAAARPDEVSFDSSAIGGYATSSWRDCLLGDAKDSDHSGGVTVEELTRCAQDKITAGLSQYPNISGQHMTVHGNSAFVPTWMSDAFAPPAVTHATREQAAVRRLTPAQVLTELHGQRDAARAVRFELRTPAPRVGADRIVLELSSQRDGYVYLAHAGSDGKSLYLLFPNALASDNRVRAGQALRLPTAGWEIIAAPPDGTETLLVMVTDTPRDITRLPAEPGGPFLKALLDDSGRARLQELLAGGTPPAECAGRAGNAECSDGFGAALLTVKTRQ